MSALRRVAEVSARLVPHRWIWAQEKADTVAAHWALRKAERPAIFDGRILMLAGMEIAGDRCEARFFETGYASMTAWLDLGCPGDPVGNGFAMGALCGADGRFILGRMGAHTANAGQLYFPAGTPDLTDVAPSGAVDLAGSLLREITEETGLAEADWTVSPRWTIVEEKGRVAFMRLVRLASPAEIACERIRRFLASQARPELAGVEIVSSPADLDPATMPAYLTAFLAAAWSGQIE